MSILSKSTTKRSDGGPTDASPESSLLALLALAFREPSHFVRVVVILPTSSLVVQFLRYTVVGGIAFACDFGSLWAATSVLGVHYLVSNIIGFVVGLLVNYWLSVQWVFAKRKFARGTVQFGLFALVGIVGVGVNELALWLFTERAGWHYLVSKIAATVVVYLWNFSIRKILIF